MDSYINFNEGETESKVLASISCILCNKRDLNNIISTSSYRSPFIGEKTPDITIIEYCKRLAKYFLLSPALYVVILIYIDRFLKSEPELVVNNSTIHRLIITSFTITSKYHEDEHYSNSYYAKVGGFDKNELNILEYTMLTSIGFDLFVTYETYSLYQDNLTVHYSICHQCNKCLSIRR